MARYNKSFYALLGIISKGEVSGYDIKQIMQKIGRFYWSENNAQIYTTLKLLEKLELVVSRLDESSGARQCRKYIMTDKGKKKLIDWLMQPCEFPKYREELLLKMVLSQHLPIEEIIGHVRHYKKCVDERIEYLTAIEKHIHLKHAARPDKPFLLIAYRQVRLVLMAKKQWAQEAIIELSAMRNT